MTPLLNWVALLWPASKIAWAASTREGAWWTFVWPRVTRLRGQRNGNGVWEVRCTVLVSISDTRIDGDVMDANGILARREDQAMDRQDEDTVPIVLAASLWRKSDCVFCHASLQRHICEAGATGK